MGERERGRDREKMEGWRDRGGTREQLKKKRIKGTAAFMMVKF